MTLVLTGVVVAALRGLYPPSKAHQRGMLPVSPLHTLVFEVHGNPKGQPVLCVHGGPGGGAYANHACVVLKLLTEPQAHRLMAACLFTTTLVLQPPKDGEMD